MSVVQQSNCDHRNVLFDDIIDRNLTIKSSGPWRPSEEGYDLNKQQFIKKEYHGRIDGLVYRDKIDFFKDSYFNMAYQFHESVDYLIQEKVIHAYAAGTIPVFRGNRFIEDVINPKRIVNTHKFKDNDEVITYCVELMEDQTRYQNMLKEPLFPDGLPEVFNSERTLSFLEKVLDD